ncbi:MAG: hypothetical protein ABI345_01010 [Jatrophihabitans sp.]
MTLLRSRGASMSDRLPDARSLAMQLAAGRSVIGVVILAAPVPAARLLGADTATAARVTWLTRMLGVRDGALGVGGLDAVRRGTSATAWLLSGGVADAVDSLVVAAAVKQGRVGGVVPRFLVLGAAGSAALHVLTAVRLRRR